METVWIRKCHAIFSFGHGNVDGDTGFSGMKRSSAPIVAVTRS